MDNRMLSHRSIFAALALGLMAGAVLALWVTIVEGQGQTVPWLPAMPDRPHAAPPPLSQPPPGRGSSADRSYARAVPAEKAHLP